MNFFISLFKHKNPSNLPVQKKVTAKKLPLLYDRSKNASQGKDNSTNRMKHLSSLVSSIQKNKNHPLNFNHLDLSLFDSFLLQKSPNKTKFPNKWNKTFLSRELSPDTSQHAQVHANNMRLYVCWKTIKWMIRSGIDEWPEKFGCWWMAIHMMNF